MIQNECRFRCFKNRENERMAPLDVGGTGKSVARIDSWMGSKNRAVAEYLTGIITLWFTETFSRTAHEEVLYSVPLTIVRVKANNHFHRSAY